MVRSAALLSVVASNQGGHHIQGGGGRHPALLPSLDGAPRNSAEIGQCLSGQPALVADRLDSGGVVQDLAAVIKDDRLAVTAGWMIGGDFHGCGWWRLSGGPCVGASQFVGGFADSTLESDLIGKSGKVSINNQDPDEGVAEAGKSFGAMMAVEDLAGLIGDNGGLLAPIDLGFVATVSGHDGGDLALALVNFGGGQAGEWEHGDCHGGQWLRARDYA